MQPPSPQGRFLLCWKLKQYLPADWVFGPARQPGTRHDAANDVAGGDDDG